MLMAKFSGVIGFAVEDEETVPGVFKDSIVERRYFGDVIKNVSKMQNGENLNDNLTIDNRLSIVADPFANEHFYAMRYVSWMGALWKVISVDVQRPRLLLTIGGVYNGPRPEA